jgi:uncharacterized protein (TIGR02145 family)
LPPSPYSAGSVFCASGATAIVDVTNPVTGKTWMDRNLGASQVASAVSTAAAYGDLYQWGRRSDGHQCRNSATTTTLSSIDQPTNGNFILAPNSPFDWRSPQNNNLWQGVNGVNNPCPAGYRLPTTTEWNSERLTWTANNSAGAFASILKLPSVGTRTGSSGTIFNVGAGGDYHSSSINGTNVWYLIYDGTVAGNGVAERSTGKAVRCIKN